MHRKMTSPLRAPTAQSLSVSVPKDNLCLRANRCGGGCSGEERAHGSRLTTIGRVVQSKTSEPETHWLLYRDVQPAPAFRQWAFPTTGLRDSS